MSYVYQYHGMFVRKDNNKDLIPIWEVGHYPPNGKFCTESRWKTPSSAAAQVSYLNGGGVNYDHAQRIR